MKNFILAVVAVVLFVFLAPIGVVVELAVATFRNNLSKFFLKVAVSIDQLGNVVCGTLFNLTLIKRNSTERFGNPDETISSVIGKNKKNKSLTWLGRWLDSVLELLDDNHSIENIEYDE